MELRIIPKSEAPSFDPTEIMLRHITYYDPPYTEYEEDEITEEVIAEILRKLSGGVNVYLSLDPDGEDNWMEVNCDGEWISLGYYTEEGEQCFYSYNSGGSEELSPLWSGGQSPIEEYLALQDIEAGRRAVEYFIRTGELYPGIDWAKQL